MKLKRALPRPKNDDWIKKGAICYDVFDWKKGIVKSTIYEEWGLKKCDVLFDDGEFVRLLISWVTPNKKEATLIDLDL